MHIPVAVFHEVGIRLTQLVSFVGNESRKAYYRCEVNIYNVIALTFTVFSKEMCVQHYQYYIFIILHLLYIFISV